MSGLVQERVAGTHQVRTRDGKGSYVCTVRGRYLVTVMAEKFWARVCALSEREGSGIGREEVFEDDDHLWAVSGPFLSSYKYEHAILTAVTST